MSLWADAQRILVNPKTGNRTARSAVICAVRIFSEERFLRKRPLVSVLANDAKCKVCLMDAEIERQQDNSVRCKNCLLPSDVWDHTALYWLDRSISSGFPPLPPSSAIFANLT